LLALGGATVAGAYGFLALGMRFGPPLVMVALGGMTLAFCAAALWRVIDPLTRDEVAVIPEARAPHRIRELEREKQAVLKAIKEIELDFQMRKISESDYREMVERYRSRALRVLSDLASDDDFRPLIERELKDRLAARAAAAKVDANTAGETVPDAQASAPPPASRGQVTATSPVADVHPGPVAGQCPACSTSNDADAQFCKKCGTKIIRSADAP
jgi:rRNA maturation endonuclease Nob1